MATLLTVVFLFLSGIHVYDQHFQTSSSLKPWPINAEFPVEPLWEGGTQVYINDPGHLTKMAVMPIYSLNL